MERISKHNTVGGKVIIICPSKEYIYLSQGLLFIFVMRTPTHNHSCISRLQHKVQRPSIPLKETVPLHFPTCSLHIGKFALIMSGTIARCISRLLLPVMCLSEVSVGPRQASYCRLSSSHECLDNHTQEWGSRKGRFITHSTSQRWAESTALSPTRGLGSPLRKIPAQARKMGTSNGHSYGHTNWARQTGIATGTQTGHVKRA